MTYRPYDMIQRQPKLKPCLDGCGALVLTKANLKRCDKCQAELWRKEAQERRTFRKQHHVREPEPFQESAEAIEAAFQQALKVVQSQRGEREILNGWRSPLAGLK